MVTQTSGCDIGLCEVDGVCRVHTLIVLWVWAVRWRRAAAAVQNKSLRLGIWGVGFGGSDGVMMQV